MAEINPAEVSAIKKRQLSGFEAKASLDEVGTVLNIGDGIANVYGLANAQYGELVEFDNGAFQDTLQILSGSNGFGDKAHVLVHLFCYILFFCQAQCGFGVS